MDNVGYTRGFRSIRDTSVWNDRYYRYYDDLRMEASPCQRLYPFGSYFIPLKRGQYVTSYRLLAARWGKDPSWVGRFLKRLERGGLIRLDKLPRRLGGETQIGTSAGTLITILNYEEDNGLHVRRIPERNAPRNTEQHIEVRRNKEEEREELSLLDDTTESPPHPVQGGDPLTSDAPPADRESIRRLEELARTIGRPVE